MNKYTEFKIQNLDSLKEFYKNSINIQTIIYKMDPTSIQQLLNSCQLSKLFNDESVWTKTFIVGYVLMNIDNNTFQVLKIKFK